MNMTLTVSRQITPCEWVEMTCRLTRWANTSKVTSTRRRSIIWRRESFTQNKHRQNKRILNWWRPERTPWTHRSWRKWTLSSTTSRTSTNCWMSEWKATTRLCLTSTIMTPKELSTQPWSDHQLWYLTSRPLMRIDCSVSNNKLWDGGCRRET